MFRDQIKKGMRARWKYVGIIGVCGGALFGIGYYAGMERAFTAENLITSFQLSSASSQKEETPAPPSLLAITKETVQNVFGKNSEEPIYEVALQKSSSSEKEDIVLGDFQKSETSSANFAETTMLVGVDQNQKDPEPTRCDFFEDKKSSSSIYINEIAWMGGDVSANDEWIELMNDLEKTIELQNWQLIDEKKEIDILFPRASLTSGAFYLLERTDDASVPHRAADFIYSGALSNSGAWLKLFDAKCNLVDEVDARTGWEALGGENVTKRTLERRKNYSWQTSARAGGTPGIENSNGVAAAPPEAQQESTPSNNTSPINSSSSESESPRADQIFISEIFYDAEGSDEGKEFIELYNAGIQGVDLTGWVFKKGDSSLLTIGSKSEDRTHIQSHGYFLIGLNSYNGAPSADVVRAASLPNETGVITIIDAQGVSVDSVSYNMSVSAGQSYERDSWENSTFHPESSPNPHASE